MAGLYTARPTAAITSEVIATGRGTLQDCGRHEPSTMSTAVNAHHVDAFLAEEIR
jgi:hypothetical protein